MLKKVLTLRTLSRYKRDANIFHRFIYACLIRRLNIVTLTMQSINQFVFNNKIIYDKILENMNCLASFLCTL